MKLGIVVFALLCSLGCSAEAPVASPDARAGSPAPAPPYRHATDVLQLMEWILDPAADAIWGSAGFVITAAGETDLSPTTDAGWQRVLNGAAVVAESGNLLMMPGREAGADWIAHSQRMTAAAELAMSAAKARDAEALFDAGGELYQACRACHEQFMVPIQEARTAR